MVPNLPHRQGKCTLKMRNLSIRLGRIPRPNISDGDAIKYILEYDLFTTPGSLQDFLGPKSMSNPPLAGMNPCPDSLLVDRPYMIFSTRHHCPGQPNPQVII